MPFRGTCRVCRHPHCAKIELEMAAGRVDRQVGLEFGVSRDSVLRHWKNHVTTARKAELVGGPVQIAKLAKRAAEEDRSLLGYFSILRSELMRLFLSCKEQGFISDAAAVSTKLLATLEATADSMASCAKPASSSTIRSAPPVRLTTQRSSNSKPK